MANFILKKEKIENLFDFPETNSKVTKKFCNMHQGNIPVYASSKDEKSTLGYIKEDLKGIHYYQNCLSWNRNGSVGYVFIRDHKFATNEDHRALMIKNEYKDLLDMNYLKFEIEKQIFLNGFSFMNKCGVDKIKDILIDIPVLEDGSLDKNLQMKFANKYIEIEALKKEFDFIVNDILKTDINWETNDETQSVLVTDILDPKKGSAKYTKKYIHEHEGGFPVYSSQTKDLGVIGSIDTFDYDEECFTWTTDGVNAGTVFYRNGKFSITTHCGILKLKAEFKDKLDYQFLDLILNKTLKKFTLGEGANKRIGKERMGEILINIPLTKYAEFDINRQREIVAKNSTIQKLKDSIKNEYISSIKNTKVEVLSI